MFWISFGSGPTSVSALHRHDLADLVQAKFGFAADDQIGNVAAFLEFGFRADLIGDAEPLEQFVDVDAARTAARGIDIGDGFRRQQRLLELVHRTDVRFGRALFDDDAHTDACKVDAAAGGDFTAGDHLIDHGRRYHQHIERLAVIDPRLEAAGGVVVDHDLIAGLLFEVGHERIDHLPEGPGGQDLDLGRDAGVAAGQTKSGR